jgi:hypothetical protein
MSQVDSDLADQINFSSELDIFHSGKPPACSIFSTVPDP